MGTSDLKSTSNFYIKALGLSIYKNQEICKIFNVTSQSKIGFCTHMPVNLKGKNPILTFVTEDVDDFYTKLLEYGVKDLSSPSVNPKFQIYHFFFKDPNGYTLEVQKFLD